MLYNETLVIEFLTHLFHEGGKYSAINSARSALSTFLINEYGITIGNSSLVKRFLKGIFELNPPVARYCMVWDVNIVLNFLSNFYPLDDLPLSILTYKLTMLLALATHQRVQTLKAISVVDIKVFRDSVFIPIKQLLKHSTQRNYKQALYLHAFPDPAICVMATLKHYLDRTSLLRGTHSQLLISFHKPHYPVSTDTIARWLRMVMFEAGVNIDLFKPHSTRAASVSAAKQSNIPVEHILKLAGWSSCKTFHTFYDKIIVPVE